MRDKINHRSVDPVEHFVANRCPLVALDGVVEVAAWSHQSLEDVLGSLDASADLEEVDRPAEHVDRQVERGRARHERLARPDQVALGRRADVEQLGKRREFDVARELAFVHVKLLAQLGVLEDGADVLLERAGRLADVGQVSPDEGQDLVDLVGFEHGLDAAQRVGAGALHDGEIGVDAQLGVGLGVLEQLEQLVAL